MPRSESSRAVRLLALALAALFACGCGAPMIEDATRHATAGAVNQSLATFGDAETQRRLEAITASPEMQKAMRDVAGGITSGVTSALTDEETAARVSKLTALIAQTAARQAVDAALAEMASPENQGRMEAIVAASATSGTRAAMDEMTRQMAAMAVVLGPTLRATLHDEVAPGLRDVLSDPELKATLAGAAFELSRQAVLGSNQGMADLEAKRKKVGTLAKVAGLLAGAGWVLPVVIAVLLATLIVVLLRRRAHARDLAARDDEAHEAPSLAHRYLAHRRRRFARRPA